MNDFDDDHDEAATEPQEDDLVTEDHVHWYQYNKLVLTVPDGAENCNVAVAKYCEEQGWWPNCWFISDHGNAHLIDLGG